MVSHHESPCPQRVTGTYSPVTVMNTVTSHEAGVEREEGAKVGCCNKSGVGRAAYIVPPTASLCVLPP